jgi:hypothetical protein
MLQTSADTFSQDFVFEGCKHRKQTGHGPAR